MYIENIYLCLAAPVAVAVFCLRKRYRKILIFFLCGMTVCLLSSYISSFGAAVTGADLTAASIGIAPLVEEFMKILPILFFLMVFEPPKDDLAAGIVLTAVGFATFENVCYLITNGTQSVLYTLIRGLGTGAMHVICAFLIAVGIVFLWDRLYLRIAGGIALFSMAVTLHGIYNLLVSRTGAVAWVGYLIPLLVMAVMIAHNKRRFNIEDL